MLDAAHNETSCRTKDIDQRVRIFKVALKASRCCLDSGYLPLTAKLIETTSKYVAAWDETTPVVSMTETAANDEDLVFKRLVCDFYLLRMAHASKCGRYDLADHFFLKSNIFEDENQDDLMERAAGLCFDIGRSHFQQKNKEVVISWLERAYKLLNSDALASRSLEHEDLRLAVVALLTDALPSDKSDTRSWDLVAELDQVYGLGNRIAVLVMQLNIVMRKSPVDIDMAASILSRMVRLTVLTDQTYLT